VDGPSPPTTSEPSVLVLGIGNVLLGDEGIGVHVVRHLQALDPSGLQCLDGGTGSLTLLEPMQAASRLVVVDATADGRPPGTLDRLKPRFASDFPPSLTAHDIGLRDLVESFYLLGRGPEVTLHTVSITWPQDMGLDLSPEVAAIVPELARRILQEAGCASDLPVR
jgi:hydrogenase maturation protease